MIIYFQENTKQTLILEYQAEDFDDQVKSIVIWREGGQFNTEKYKSKSIFIFYELIFLFKIFGISSLSVLSFFSFGW